MKLQANFAPRRDGTYGHVTDMTGELRMKDRAVYQIDSNGMVDVPNEFAQQLINKENFILVDRGIDSKHFINDTNKHDFGVIALDGAISKDTPTMNITNGDTTIDLMTLGKQELFRLANDEQGLKMHHKSSVTTLREAIYASATK